MTLPPFIPLQLEGNCGPLGPLGGPKSEAISFALSEVTHHRYLVNLSLANVSTLLISYVVLVIQHGATSRTSHRTVGKPGDHSSLGSQSNTQAPWVKSFSKRGRAVPKPETTVDQKVQRPRGNPKVSEWGLKHQAKHFLVAWTPTHVRTAGSQDACLEKHARQEPTKTSLQFGQTTETFRNNSRGQPQSFPQTFVRGKRFLSKKTVSGPNFTKTEDVQVRNAKFTHPVTPHWPAQGGKK